VGAVRSTALLLPLNDPGPCEGVRWLLLQALPGWPAVAAAAAAGGPWSSSMSRRPVSSTAGMVLLEGHMRRWLRCLGKRCSGSCRTGGVGARSSGCWSSTDETAEGSADGCADTPPECTHAWAGSAREREGRTTQGTTGSDWHMYNE
jgi:hypothetical protein